MPSGNRWKVEWVSWIFCLLCRKHTWGLILWISSPSSSFLLMKNCAISAIQLRQHPTAAQTVGSRWVKAARGLLPASEAAGCGRQEREAQARRGKARQAARGNSRRLWAVLSIDLLAEKKIRAVGRQSEFEKTKRTGSSSVCAGVCLWVYAYFSLFVYLCMRGEERKKRRRKWEGPRKKKWEIGTWLAGIDFFILDACACGQNWLWKLLLKKKQKGFICFLNIAITYDPWHDCLNDQIVSGLDALTLQHFDQTLNSTFW